MSNMDNSVIIINPKAINKIYKSNNLDVTDFNEGSTFIKNGIIWTELIPIKEP